MTAKPFILAAAALAAGAFVNINEASAGGGVRLNFGGPLGSFVASPYSSGHGHRRAHKPYFAPSYGGQHAYGRPAARKPVATASRKTEEPRAATPRKKVETAKTESKEDTTIQQVATNAVPLEATTPPAAPVTTATAPAVTTGSIAPAAASLVPAAITTETEKPVTNAKPATTKAKTAEKKNDCRRFIPAAGITVSVRCGS